MEKCLVNEDLKLGVVRTDANVDIVSTFPWVALTLFFPPFALAERVEHKLQTNFAFKFVAHSRTFPSSKRTLTWSGTSFPLKSADAVWRFTVNLKKIIKIKKI